MKPKKHVLFFFLNNSLNLQGSGCSAERIFFSLLQLSEVKWHEARDTPRCSCRPRFSPRQGTDPRHFCLWRSSAQKTNKQSRANQASCRFKGSGTATKARLQPALWLVFWQQPTSKQEVSEQMWIWQNLEVKTLEERLSESGLTATMRFMASSFRESLLLSSISFKSSCLQMRDPGIEKNKTHRLALLTILITQKSSKKGRPAFFFICKHWKFIKVCERDPEIIPFEVRNSSGKIWRALKVQLVGKKN